MIISFSQLGKHGRLGNQLFQVASTLGLAERYGAEAVFPGWAYEEFFELQNAEGRMQSGIPHGEMQSKRMEEVAFHHHDWNIRESCDIRGYLQSEKYFGSTKLRLKEEFVEGVKFQVSGSRLFEKETICIQVRRGDYVGNKNYYQIPVTFYIDALLTHFPNWRECNLLFTSDDIAYCQVHFGCLPNATFSVGNSEIEDLALASCCDHFIISNSTFGWWGAWLGEMRNVECGMMNTKVVHSGQLFAGPLEKTSDARDYRPERWIEHKKESYQIPMRDVTFTIPVHYDHLDRKRNLDLSLCLLQKAFDAEFIICEQGGNKFEYTQQWARYMKSEGKKFHRTKMLNDMANAAETEIVINWDADVIIPPMQILMAVEELRNGADMVFPYGGPFARMPKVMWFERIEKALDIGVVGSTRFKGREADHFSVGGAVMFSKEAFIEGGMENENFVSFGPEDVERFERFTRLGFDVRRVPGALFHMQHWVGPNSSSMNPAFRANHAELDKMRKMSVEELRAYVDTWPWRNPYTARYYRRISEGSMRSAKIVMEQLAISFQQSAFSVIDVGCGVGEWHNGNPDYFGVDYRVKEKDLLIPLERFIECDLNVHVLKVDRKFDLCLCLEVAEHLNQDRAEALVEMLCGLSDQVLFSAAIPFQGGVGHVNEQWQSWWGELFKRNGFGASEKQPDLSDEGIELWYRQNMVLYERGATDCVRDYVLPAYYMEIAGNLVRIKNAE